MYFVYIIFLYTFCSSKTRRSVESRKRKNKKTKIRQKKAKTFASAVLLAEKDNIIENLKADVLVYKSKLKHRDKSTLPCAKPQMCYYKTSTIRQEETTIIATQGKRHFGISKARQTVLASLSGITSFESKHIQWISTSNRDFGSGQFGELKLLRLQNLGIVAAAKVCNT